MHKAQRSIEGVAYYFSRSSIQFQGHTGQKINDLNPILSKITRLVTAIKSLRFALFMCQTPGMPVRLPYSHVPVCPYWARVGPMSALGSHVDAMCQVEKCQIRILPYLYKFDKGRN